MTDRLYAMGIAAGLGLVLGGWTLALASAVVVFVALVIFEDREVVADEQADMNQWVEKQLKEIQEGKV